MFRFRKFSIQQDRCAMKVGTDGVLLGAWAKVPHERRALDIGTGTGLLALMLAQRSPRLFITGIEPHAADAQQALSNTAKSEWSQRIHIENAGLADFNPTSPYELIICNPPFHSEPTRSDKPHRDSVRWVGNLAPHALMQFAAKHLTASGKLSMITTHKLLRTTIDIAARQGLFPQRLTRVKTTQTKPYSRCLMEFGRVPTRPVQENLILFDNDVRRTEPFNILLAPFVLK